MNEVTIIFWKNTPSTNKITLSHRITGTKGYIYTIRNGGYFTLRAITASMQARIFGAGSSHVSGLMTLPSLGL